jgi:hypothetical protein
VKPWVTVAIPELWGDSFLAAVPIESLQNEEGHEAVTTWLDKLIKLSPMAAANDQ